jgi:hypothetical protein
MGIFKFDTGTHIYFPNGFSYLLPEGKAPTISHADKTERTSWLMTSSPNDRWIISEWGFGHSSPDIYFIRRSNQSSAYAVRRGVLEQHAQPAPKPAPVALYNPARGVAEDRGWEIS